MGGRFTRRGRLASTEQKRPRGVPRTAHWDPRYPGFEWVEAARDADGRRHGPCRSWNLEGILHGECTYDHGKLHGKNINYHPDGTVSSIGDWVQGECMNTVFYRSDSPSPEPFPPDAAISVWEARFFSRNGRTHYTQTYYTRDGRQVTSAGEELPPRPANVPPQARYISQRKQWVSGEIERGSNNQVGPWKWWEADGTLRHEEERDEGGEACRIVHYRADGTLESRQTFGEQGGCVEREKFHENGQRFLLARKDELGREVYKAYWSPDGELSEEVVSVYEGDLVVSKRERGPGGAPLLEAEYDGTGMFCILYGDNRSRLGAGSVVDGVLSGTWRIYDPSGELTREIDTTSFAIKAHLSAGRLRYQLGEALFRHRIGTWPTPEVLSGVGDIPWSEVEGCFQIGVSDFPQLLCGMTLPDPLARRYAFDEISREILYRGTIYEATGRVAPFLVRLLEHENSDRDRILWLLRQAGKVAKQSVQEARDLDEGDPRRVAALGTIEAVAAGWPTLWSMMESGGDEVRQRILALAKIPTGRPQIRTDLAELATRHGQPELRACAALALAEVDGAEPADVAHCLEDGDLLVRAVAAIALGRNFGPDSPARAVEVLGEAVQRSRELELRFAGLPFADGHLLSYLALAAGSIHTPQARALAPALCSRFESVDGISATSYGRGLLALAFGNGEPPFAPEFVDILETLATSKRFYAFTANAHEVLASWNLPRDGSDLFALVTELRSAGDAAGQEAMISRVMQAR